jgi:hypothetical protein
VFPHPVLGTKLPVACHHSVPSSVKAAYGASTSVEMSVHHIFVALAMRQQHHGGLIDASINTVRYEDAWSISSVIFVTWYCCLVQIPTYGVRGVVDAIES